MRIVQSDTELVRRVKAGQTDVFVTLVQRYERSVRGAALRVLYDHHEAQDVAQESFIAAFRQLNSLRDEEKFGPWVLQIARRLALRSAQRQRVAVSAIDGDEPTTRSEARQIDCQRHLIELVERLPEHEQIVITMHYFDGHSVADISAINESPVGTVTKQLSRAYQRLREWYQESEK